MSKTVLKNQSNSPAAAAAEQLWFFKTVFFTIFFTVRRRVSDPTPQEVVLLGEDP